MIAYVKGLYGVQQGVEWAKLSLFILIILLLAEECNRKGEVSDSGVGDYLPHSPRLHQLQSWTWSFSPGPTYATESLPPAVLLQSRPVTEGTVTGHWTFTKDEDDGKGWRIKKTVCWKVTNRIVTQVQCVFRPSPTSPLPCTSKKIYIFFLIYIFFPNLPSFLHQSGPQRSLSSPPTKWILLGAIPRATRLNQSVPLWLNVPVILHTALHFNRGFLEINSRTKEFTTLNTSGPLEHDNKGMQKAGGAFWALGPTPAYQLPSPLRSGPPRHTARSQGERWVFTPSGKASWALHNPYNHSYSHVSVVPEASLSIYRAQATISQDFSIFSPPTIEINTWRLKALWLWGHIRDHQLLRGISLTMSPNPQDFFFTFFFAMRI